MTSSNRTARGFTLVELLVAILLFAILAAMMYPALGNVLKHRQVMQISMERTASLQKAILIIQSDFEQLRLRGIRDEFGDSKPAFYTISDTPGRSLEFTRGGISNPLKQNRSSLARVAYGFDDGKLIRYQWRVLDRAQDSVPLSVNLLDNVTAVSFRFLGEEEWQSEWPSSDAEGNAPDTLPRAVEITFTTDDWGEIRRIFHGVY